MTTYSDAVSTTSGTAASTFGTGQNLTVAKVDSRIQFLGLTVAGVDTVITTAEGSNIILRVDSPSLQRADQRFETGPYITSGPGTNSSGQVMNAEITPVNWTAGGNEIITFSTAVSAANTTGKLNNVCAMYSDTGLPPNDWRADYPSAAPTRGGYVSTATQATVARTALTAITVPTWVQEMVAYKASALKTGAVVTAQSILGLFDLTSSIPNIAPMKFTTNGGGATLGTPVGTGYYHEELRQLPLYFENVGGSQTITPNITLNNAVTNGPSCTFGIYWR
jgi:hypothetical protein